VHPRTADEERAVVVLAAGRHRDLSRAREELPRDRLPVARDLCRRPLGDHLAAVAELPADDLAALLSIIDGLVAKNRLKALAGGLS